MNGTMILCICGRLCTSKPGLTLHQKNCKFAKEAKQNGDPTVQKSSIIGPEIDYIPEVQEIYILAKDACLDSHNAIANKNKSAGRRARVMLLELRSKIIPLRKHILQSIKYLKNNG
jgi:hypothetical protein